MTVLPRRFHLMLFMSITDLHILSCPNERRGMGGAKIAKHKHIRAAFSTAKAAADSIPGAIGETTGSGMHLSPHAHAAAVARFSYAAA
jgi:hypothetical protein